MGYYQEMMVSDVTFDVSDKDKVREALRKVLTDVHPGGMRSGPDGREYYLSWGPSIKEIAARVADLDENPISTLVWVLEGVGFTVSDDRDEDGTVSLEYWEYSKAGNELDVLYVLCDIVKDGSEVQCRGEDGALYGLRFTDGTVFNIHGEVTWVV